MASSGKRKNKTTWKAAQNELIQISGVRNCSWADEVENEAEEHYDPKPVVLPTAPRASCMVAVDESKVPHNPPFQAHVSNLPYELTDNELRSLFSDSNVKEVRIPKEEKGNRARGYGYVEFEDRGSLLSALHMGDTYVKGRSVRIELATSDSGRGGGRSRGNQRNDSGSMNSSSIDRTAGNWRSGPRDDTEDRDRGFDRGGPRRDYGQGGFSRRDDSFHDRDRRDDRYPARERESRERFKDDRSKYDDWSSRDSERRFRKDDRDRNEPISRNEPLSEPKNRPKLNLQPRSSNLPPPSGSSDASSSASIFGNAKPVDTSAKLREIEERLAKSDMLSEKSRSGGSSTGSSGGPATARPQEGKDKKLEPAQPPKENAWNKSRIPQQQEKRASRPDEKKGI